MALPLPIAYWLFDEGSGTAVQNSMSGASPATVTNGTWVAGKFGNALNNASGSHGATLGASLDFGTAHTISCWIKDWDGSDDGIILGGGNGFYAFYLDATDVYYSAGVGNFVTRPHGGGLTGGWHHLAVARTGGDVQFYKNGVALGARQSGVGSNALTVQGLLAYYDGTFPFHASVDDLRVYDVELDAAQIAELYAQTSSLEVGFVFGQDFRTGSGGTCTSVQGDTGTLSGAAPPTWDAGESALRFNGGNMNNSYVSFGALASTADLWKRPGPTPFSVFVRMLNDSFPSVMVSRDTNADDGGGWQYEIGSGFLGLVKAGNPSPRWNLINLATIPNLQAFWRNVCVSDPGTVTAGSEQHYTQGVARTTTNSGAGSNSASSDAAEALTIGRGRLWVNGNACSFNGLLQVVCLWRRALSGTEVAELQADPYLLLTAPTPPPSGSTFPGLFLGL